jgi:aldose 1-epimerase
LPSSHEPHSFEPTTLRLETDDATVVVDAARGGRVASITVGDLDLLVGPGTDPDPLQWGSYPMVPFAGRIREGRFTFEETTHRLPATMGDHAIHGYGHTSAWDIAADDTIAWTMGPPWPWPGRVEQQVALEPGSLTVTMTVTAHETQPVMIGWHPWFRRSLAGGHELTFDLPAARMYERDTAGIPTGRLVAVPDGPWDDCFTDLAADPVLRWGDALTVTIGSTCDHWVIYSKPEDALCVEPQSGAPDAVNRDPEVLAAGEQLRHSMTLRWS